MAEIKKKQLQTEFYTLRKITQLPKLYFANFFFELRNEVDKDFVSKLIISNDKEKDNKLKDTWQQTISKIYSFEEQCINKMDKKMSYEYIEERLNSIELMIINRESSIGLEEIEEAIENEEIKFLSRLFQNKTIAFIYPPYTSNSMKKLIVINDEYINSKVIQRR